MWPNCLVLRTQILTFLLTNYICHKLRQIKQVKIQFFVSKEIFDLIHHCVKSKNIGLLCDKLCLGQIPMYILDAQLYLNNMLIFDAHNSFVPFLFFLKGGIMINYLLFLIFDLHLGMGKTNT